MNVYNNPLIGIPSKPLPKHIGIIGAGTIGPDIAYYLKSAIPGLSLVLIDIVEDQLDQAVKRIEGYAGKGVKRGKLTADQAAGVMENLDTSTDYSTLAECDWVIEAATENLDLKHEIFAQVESIVREDTLITSNTSSIPAAWLFSKLKHQGRCTVTHFFAPAFSNPVVEVVDWDGGSDENLEYLRWLFCATGKVPMVTTDDVCFMLDRIFDNWCNEAAYLLTIASASEIDSVALDYVHAGPFDVLNFANGIPRSTRCRLMKKVSITGLPPIFARSRSGTPSHAANRSRSPRKRRNVFVIVYLELSFPNPWISLTDLSVLRRILNWVAALPSPLRTVR
jgi:enoyl-CoA hydratase/3-hydroxyacyl-CoA dehydrogenase